MLDIASLQLSRNLITTSDFLSLHGLDPALEPARGKFETIIDHLPPSVSYSNIPNHEYDTEVARVDRMPESARLVSEDVKSTGFGKRVREAIGGSLVEDWDELKKRLGWKGDDIELEDELVTVGVYPLWTWRGV